MSATPIMQPGDAPDDGDLERGRPIPDLLDHGGRLRRFAIAAAVATLAAVLAGTFAYALARDDLESGKRYLSDGAWRFVLFFTVISWGLAWWGAQWWLERRVQRRGLIPDAAARLRRRR